MGPHTAEEMTIGMSSLIVMVCPCTCSTHFSWNQDCPEKAPHPQLPEASEVIHALGATLLTAFIMATPFQELAKVCHHSMSDRACWFRRIKWSRWLVVVDK